MGQGWLLELYRPSYQTYALKMRAGGLSPPFFKKCISAHISQVAVPICVNNDLKIIPK